VRYVVLTLFYAWFLWFSIRVSLVLAFLVLLGALLVLVLLVAEALHWAKEDGVRWAKAAVAAWWQQVVQAWSGR